jgi:hypothetical protein
MKRNVICVIAVVIIISFLFPVYSFSFQNEPDDFRGIKWGTNIKELRKMKLVEDDKTSKYYIRKSDKLIIGKAALKSISYGFYDDRFYFGYIRFNSHDNFSGIKEALSEQYGAGVQNSIEECIWTGQNVDISLRYNEASGRGKIYYIFKPIAKEKDGDKKEQPKEGTSNS